MVVGGDGNEVPQLLGCQHILQKDALIHLVIESDLVKCLFQLPTKHLIVNKCLARQEMQVLLEGLADELLWQVLEEGQLRGLAAQEGEHAPRDAHDWEVSVIFPVVLRRPLHDAMHLGQVLVILIAQLGVTGDVDARDLG